MSVTNKMGNLIINIVYLFYFTVKTNYSDLRASFKCTRNKGYHYLYLLFHMLYCTLRYGSSFVDYFNFQFYSKDHHLRKAYATMGYMYKFHKTVNNKFFTEEIDNKNRFRINFKDNCSKSYTFLPEEKQQAVDVLKSKVNNKIVIKDPNSTAGKSIRIVDIVNDLNEIKVSKLTITDFVDKEMERLGILYFEDYIQQHESIHSISPSGVNTIRVISLINNSGSVEIIGSIFRISVNSPIDNYSAGNIAAEIDIKSGIVKTGAIRKRSSCDHYHDVHEITNQSIKGFKIPYWEECLKSIRFSAMKIPEVRSVGWDVAISKDGPVIIEGNSKWNKDTWQIPAGNGKKEIIENILAL